MLAIDYSSAMMQLLVDMHTCMQTEGQSVYEHGFSVLDHTLQLIQFLRTGQISEGWVLPEWLSGYSQPILKSLAPQEVIEEYTLFHDCGKPYCKPDGKNRFPNHAEVSYFKWLEVGGSLAAARLMRFDMMIHTIKHQDLGALIALPEAPTLLLVGLAEVHANSKMFGGMDSTSFKIKWKQIDKRGRAICQRLYGTR